MSDDQDAASGLPDELSEYLQTFLDETEEQLDDLIDTMLVLERDAADRESLNEAFRLIHTIKGSAGMMGLDNIATLTHQLENRFERFRAGVEQLDEMTTSLVLRCIDFLRDCTGRLRSGQALGSAAELLEELQRLEETGASNSSSRPKLGSDDPPSAAAVSAEPVAALEQQDPGSQDELTVIVVRFREGLQLTDLKAQLIVTRLSHLGDVRGTRPTLEQLSESVSLQQFTIYLDTAHDGQRLRAAADVDGVVAVELSGHRADTRDDAEAVAWQSATNVDDGPSETDDVPVATQPEVAGQPLAKQPLPAAGDAPLPQPSLAVEREPSADESISMPARVSAPSAAAVPDAELMKELPAAERAAAKVAETMRVDIDRLDELMNLAGELVVNRARFVQITSQLSPALRKTSVHSRVRDFGDSLRRAIERMERAEADGDWSVQIQQLRAGLELVEQQAEAWDQGRRYFSQMGEAIDQLSRVSHRLQRGVLDTRMVPVGPLFNRFKRVVRDLASERDKQVNLAIRGEKTELDKRMIDELNDPLVHLVRNSIDHGLEATDVRRQRGKPEVGTIRLEASHRGNSVYVVVRDDGAGIDVARIKSKLVENGLLSESAAAGLTDEQAIDYIWHPGFSTARAVTDVSGRGVGMDVVRTRIEKLNGSIDVRSEPQRGTTFTIRLPLTLAIIKCLLVRIRGVVFSMPIDDVREIVSLDLDDVITVHGRRTFEVRGQFMPLVSVDDVFHWHRVNYGHRGPGSISAAEAGAKAQAVVVLQAGGKVMGLSVDELLGSQDTVIKSLSENFVAIPGLSGASILGDGSVCLMLDVSAVIELGSRPPTRLLTKDAM